MGRAEARIRTANMTVMFLFSLPLTACLQLTLSVSQAKDHFVHPAACGGFFNSSDAKTGRIFSPNYPNVYPLDTVCHFRFFGTGSERVQLTFLDLDLDYVTGDPKNPTDCKDADSVLVRLVESQRDLGLYCGSKRPPILMSPSTRLELIFTSGRSMHTNRGFIANYSFVTNFGLKTGKQDSGHKCIFHYESVVRSSGNFTSPNFPGLYPASTECHYLFYAKDDERIHIRFLYFDVEGLLPSCSEDTQSDFVEFSNFNIQLLDRKMVRLCGTSHESGQKVVQSDGNFFRVTFKSNDVYDATGFKAFYEFIQVEDPEEAKKMARSASGVTSAVSMSVVFLKLIAFVAYSVAS